jgi:dihydrofolate reductase
MSMSLDGFVAGPNGEADWIFRSQSDDSTAWTVESLWQAGLHAMGSRTYRDMASYWPTATDLFAAPMNEIPKIVFTRQNPFDPHAGDTTTALRDARQARQAQGGAPAPEPSPSAANWASARIANGDLAASHNSA